MKRLPALDPAAARSALRLMIIAMAVFIVGKVALDNDNVALFGFFGTFALLVFAQFTGPRRSRMHAYLGLTAVGFPLLALGTLCSRDAWLAGGTMAVVAFVILFAGVVSGYVAASAISALLLFVLPVMIPAADSQIPDRLAGWALACALAIPAAFLLWPDRPQRPIRRRIADACRAIAACLDDEAGADPSGASDRANAALAAVREAHRRYVATPYRPTGATGPTAAVAHLVNDVAWTAPLAMAKHPPSCFPSESTELKAASQQVLQASASLLERGPERPDLERLDRCREAIGAAFRRRLAAAATEDGADLASGFDEAFRMRYLSYAVWQIGVQALLSTGRPAPQLGFSGTVRRGGSDPSRLRAIRKLIAGYASPDSVWFRNSIRGAAALGVAVLLGQLTDVQHGFWVVLGTLSVLRSNALNTGSTVLRALAGTVIGIIIGGALIFAIGADTAVLWAILPVTLLVAAYAPRAISFAAGQAAFTVAVLTLFDLIQPSGWQTGLIRVEDIGIGCGISLGLGLLFWPRGAAGVVRDSVAAAYARAAAFLAANVETAVGSGTGDRVERAAEDAAGASLRLDDAFRQYLAERSTARLDLDSLGSLIAGATRVLRIAHLQRSGHALFALTPGIIASAELAGPRRTLEREIAELHSWFDELGDSVARHGAAPKPLPATADTETQVLEWVEATHGHDDELSRGLAMAWEDKLLGILRAVQPRLAEAAGTLGSAHAPLVGSRADDGRQ